MSIAKSIPKSISKLHADIFPLFANGSYVYTSKVEKYLDLTSGIGALSTGHNHPYIINKVKNQLHSYVHFPQQIFQSHPIQAELNQKILQTVKDTHLDNIFYVNSGSEATDNAIKIARKYTGKSNIIAMSNGFHGRTLGALSVTSSNTRCKLGISPLMSNVYFCEDFTNMSLDKVFSLYSDKSDTAAILLESVQGEGGIHSIPNDFLKYIKKICIHNNILLIADEVQCGAMRTGSWWNITSKGIEPDILTFGKGIASGYPMAGLIGKSDVMNSLEPGTLGGTYGGNAICSAAASATIDILEELNLSNEINDMGLYIKNELKKNGIIKEIRQYGLMIGIEFDEEVDVQELVYRLKQFNVLVLVCGNNNQYIRLLPPLNISQCEIDRFLYIMNTLLDRYMNNFK